MNFPTIYSITEDEIDLNDLLAKITLTSTGAAAIFAGMVRGEPAGAMPMTRSISNTKRISHGGSQDETSCGGNPRALARR